MFLFIKNKDRILHLIHKMKTILSWKINAWKNHVSIRVKLCICYNVSMNFMRKPIRFCSQLPETNELEWSSTKRVKYNNKNFLRMQWWDKCQHFFFLLLFLIIQCSWYDDIWLLKMFILKQQLNADRMRFFKKMFWRSCKETKKQQRLMEFRYKNVEVISCYVDLKRERRRKKKFPFSLYGLHQVNIYIYPLQINNAFIAESDRQFQWKSWFVNEITKNYWEKKHFFYFYKWNKR